MNGLVQTLDVRDLLALQDTLQLSKLADFTATALKVEEVGKTNKKAKKA